VFTLNRNGCSPSTEIRTFCIRRENSLRKFSALSVAADGHFDCPASLQSPAIIPLDVRKKFGCHCSIQLNRIEKDSPTRQFGGFGFGIGSALDSGQQVGRKIGYNSSTSTPLGYAIVLLLIRRSLVRAQVEEPVFKRPFARVAAFSLGTNWLCAHFVPILCPRHLAVGDANPLF
jgi:hypothetical protein